MQREFPDNLTVFFSVYVCISTMINSWIQKNLLASRTHSYCAQFASLASLSAPRARDLIVAPCAPFFLDLAFSYPSYALRIHLSLFLIISYWISNQFYNITNDLNHENHERLYRPLRTHSHYDTRASCSIFCINFSNFNKHITYLG